MGRHCDYPRLFLKSASHSPYPRWIAACLPLFVLILLGLSFGCSEQTTEPATSLRHESDDFIFESTTDYTTLQEMKDLNVFADTILVRLIAFVGPENKPNRKIRVVLEGDWRSPGPYTERGGTIHLFRYPEDQGGYRAQFAHELVHSCRVDYRLLVGTWIWPSDGFFEEGFAEFAALQIDPEKTSFPLFGFDEDAVVGHWVVNNEHVPMDTLRKHHRELNLLCQIQAYPTRASWYHHILDAYGIQAVLDLAYIETEPTSDAVKAIVGVSLEDLDQQWEQWVSARYAALPGAAVIAEAYGERIRDANFCRAGIDY